MQKSLLPSKYHKQELIKTSILISMLCFILALGLKNAKPTIDISINTKYNSHIDSILNFYDILMEARSFVH